MSSLIEKELRNLNSDYLTTAELGILLPLSDNARHAQVKRALEQGYLISLKRGVYRRAGYLEKVQPHPFEMAQYLLWPSYVSLESSLSYHGLIPEAVYSTTCVTPKIPHHIQNAYGVFDYKKIPSKGFFTGVMRIEEKGYIYYVAKPWKALCDYVYCYKKNWSTLDPLISSLRIEKQDLPILSENERDILIEYYYSRRIERFLKGIFREYRNY